MAHLTDYKIPSKDARWKSLMGGSILSSFAQRVTAVFQYLDIENLGFFSLTDMNDKGAEVFDYLSISLDHTSFGFMDTFRKIDVDGSGEIDEDEFAVGIIELLRSFRHNQKLLDNIAMEVVPMGNISWDELAVILENNHNDSESTKRIELLNTHFGAMLYLLKDRVNANMARDDSATDMITGEEFVGIMQGIVDMVVLDLRRHFHLPRKSKLDFAKSTREVDILSALTKHKMEPAVWNLDQLGPKLEIGGRRSKRLKGGDGSRVDEMNKVGAMIPGHGDVVKHIKGLGMDPFDERCLEDIDVDRMRILQNVAKNIGNFLDIVSGKSSDVEGLSMMLMADNGLNADQKDSLQTVLTMEKMLDKLASSQRARSVVGGSVIEGGDKDGEGRGGHGGIGVQNDLMEELLELQSQCRYKDARLELLELMQSHVTTQPGATDESREDEDAESFYSMESITNEMRLVKATLSKIGNQDSLLCQLLEEEYAIVPVGDEDKDELGPVVGEINPDDLSASRMVEELAGIVMQVRGLQGAAAAVSSEAESSRIDVITQNHAAEMAQLTLLKEEVEYERNHMMHVHVEMQVLRDKGSRVDEAEHGVIVMKGKMLDLQRKVFELEQALKDALFAKEAAESYAEQNRPDELMVQIKSLQRQLRENQHQRNKFQRENQRLVLTTKQSEQRFSAMIQENVNLRTELNGYKDDLNASTVFLAAMQKKVEQERVLRSDRELLMERVRDLRQACAMKDADLAESAEDSKQARKLKVDIESLEDINRELQDRVRLLESENERGQTSVDQMDEYRKLLRRKDAEMRELQVKLYKQESTIQEFKYSESRYKAMEEEIGMYKNKVEKIPALVSEVARLRGSSRATSKALDDQDKQLNEYKKSSATFDRENSRLKADLRRHVDTEVKYQDAQEHMGKFKVFLSTPTGDSKTGGGGGGSAYGGHSTGRGAEAEPADTTAATAIKSLPGDYKKIRKMMRASIVANSGVVRPELSRTIEAAIESTMSPMKSRVLPHK